MEEKVPKKPRITNKEKSKLHAEHNENVCKHLSRKADFTDWVITTSFYSALHYVSHKIFPFKVKNTDLNKTFNFECFDSYFDELRRAKDKRNKHSVMEDLVTDNCEPISDIYSWLLNACMSARYIDYKVERQIADQATKRLKEIKEYCIS